MSSAIVAGPDAGKVMRNSHPVSWPIAGHSVKSAAGGVTAGVAAGVAPSSAPTVFEKIGRAMAATARGTAANAILRAGGRLFILIATSLTAS